MKRKDKFAEDLLGYTVAVSINGGKFQPLNEWWDKKTDVTDKKFTADIADIAIRAYLGRNTTKKDKHIRSVRVKLVEIRNRVTELTGKEVNKQIQNAMVHVDNFFKPKK